MNAYKVTFANGDSLVTSMNADLQEARAYYIGTAFQFGDTDQHPADLMVKAVSVEAIPAMFERINPPCNHYGLVDCATSKMRKLGNFTLRDFEALHIELDHFRRACSHDDFTENQDGDRTCRDCGLTMSHAEMFPDSEAL